MPRSGRISSRLSLCQAVLLAGVIALVVSACAQDAADKPSPPKTAVEGYITAVHSPSSFDVNGQRVTTTPATAYKTLGFKEPAKEPTKDSTNEPAKESVTEATNESAKEPAKDDASPDGIRVGAYVRILGAYDPTGMTQIAATVLFRDDWSKKLSGMGLIDKVFPASPQPFFRADGYIIRITAATQVTYAGDLTPSSEIPIKTWLGYEGTRDKSGALIATRARFIPFNATLRPVQFGQPQPTTSRAARIRARHQQIIAEDSLIDADGDILSLHAKVRMGDAGGSCGWHKVIGDQPLQERVRRVGMSVVPDYEKLFAAVDPLKIPFRFYVIDDPKAHSEIFCNEGLILVPRQIVERLKTDDQLAAVLADGVAFNLQLRSPRLRAESWKLLDVQGAGDIAAVTVPGLAGVLALEPILGVGTDIGANYMARKFYIEMDEQRGRVALSLMADAGYDPHQAPEAWRLLEPRKLPPDPGSLKYPNRSGYQLGILNLQYNQPVAPQDQQQKAPSPQK